MDKLKKSGMDMDMNIEQMDWVEDNKKVLKLSMILKLKHGTNFLFISGQSFLHLRIVGIEK